MPFPHKIEEPASIDDVVAVRRMLHRHPELGFLEYRTASFVASRLKAAGWQVAVGPQVMVASEMLGAPSQDEVAAAIAEAHEAGADPDWLSRMPDGQTGLVATLVRGQGPIIALRFDMDALPVTETDDDIHQPAREGFGSRREGCMHACGHDGHTAIGLAVAARLAASENWAGTVKLVFQPAEEGGRGARPMVASGFLDDVDYLFAAHLGGGLPSGEIALRVTGMLCSRKMSATFSGKAAHAASAPNEGRNAILAAAQATIALHAIAGHLSDLTRINVGMIAGGRGRNIVPDSCRIDFEFRAANDAGLAYLEKRVDSILKGAALAQDCSVQPRIVGATDALNSDGKAAEWVRRAATGVEGVWRIRDEWFGGAGEDCSFMMQRVQGNGGLACYFMIGSDIAAPHHAANFDVDEGSLPIGVKVFVNLVEGISQDAAAWPASGFRQQITSA